MANVNRWGVDLDKIRGPDGRIKTVALFADAPIDTPSTEPPLYALKNTNKGVPCLRDIYMEVGDPTEYAFALEAFGSWEAWQRIAGPDAPGWFRPYLHAWRDELEVKLRREAFVHMQAMAKGKTDAAKWIAEGRWNARGAGRPSKADVERETTIRARTAAGYNEDAKRLGLMD